MKKRVSGQMLLGFAFIVSVFFSCGLETNVVLDPPTIIRYASGTIDPAYRYFYFQTIGNPGGAINFQGTAVLYKIYASESAMNSDITSISNVNTQYSSNGFSLLSTLGYKELYSTTRSDPLIPSGGSTSVVIRLFDEGSYTARIHGNDSVLTPPNSPTWGIPLRRPNGKGFNFFAAAQTEQDANPAPLPGDSDVNYTGSAGSAWYVNAYAVSVGRDEYYTYLHSQLLHLGYIRITG